MKASFVWRTFALVLLIISLLLTIPARLVADWLLLPENVQLLHPSGRVIAGQFGQIVIENQAFHLLSWEWQPLALFTGKLTADWQLKDPNIRAKGIVAKSILGQVYVKNATAEVNLQALDFLLPKQVRLEGAVDIVTDEIVYLAGVQQLSAKVTGKNINVSVNPVLLNLKNVQLDVTADQIDSVDIVLIDTVTHSFMIHAQINQDHLHLQGNIKASTDIAKQLQGILPLIATKVGNQWQLSWHGKYTKLLDNLDR